MRPSLLLAAALLLAPLAHAEDRDGKEHDNVECSIDASGKDRVAKGHDVVVNAGELVEDAVAVDGNVVVRKGAHVKSALALHGSVTVEAGAQVEDSVVAIGGKVKVDPSAHVAGSSIALDDKDGLHLRSDDGEDLDVAINIGGKSLAQKVLEPIIAGIHRCRITRSN
jgi:hypothetical protein